MEIIMADFYFLGVKYFSAVEYFPHTQPELWSRDGVSRISLCESAAVFGG